MKSSLLVLAGVWSCLLASQASPAHWEISSPGGTTSIAVSLSKGRIVYQVQQGAPNGRSLVIKDSPLGLKFQEQDFLQGLRLESVTAPVTVEESYTMSHGKRHRCFNTGRAVTLRFRNHKSALLALDLRAYDDGVAFRYRVPAQAQGPWTLRAEATGVRFPQEGRLWMQPNDKVSTYAPAYETYYENGVGVGAVSPTSEGWAFPVLFCTGDEKHWGLFTEANLGTNYFGGRLTASATNGVYEVRLPDPAEGHGYGPLEPSSTLPWEMPWRVLILGDSPGAVVESTLVDDLSAPTTLAEMGWVRPGRVTWSWWSDQDSPRDGVKQKRFIDFAAEMGWEYVLVDANWPIMDKGNVQEVIRYAKEKRVGVLLWYNTGGANNVVTEKPRGSLFYPEVRRHEFELLKGWGVKGIKVDFFQSDKPEIIRLYQDILKDAAQFQLMVNFHGCTLPRGWTRTYPHLMSMEAVRGEESYLFDAQYPERAAEQNTVTPFTRNAVGPMDYTPMALSNGKYPHKTTYAHELALTVLFETGWLHFADDPDAYRKLPEPAQQFIREVPVVWDDTRFIAGYPGREVVLARRSGSTWYLAGVNGRNEPAALTLDLKRILGSAKYDLLLISDGAGPQSFSSATRPLNSAESLSIQLLARGGFVATLRPRP